MTARRIPQPGEIWADNDDRQAGRTVRVESIENKQVPSRYASGAVFADYAVCTVLTEAHDKAARAGKSDYRSTIGSIVRIRVDRMKPTTTGFRFLREG